MDQLPQVKAFVVWGEPSLPEEFKSPRYFLWKDFLKSGAGIGTDVIEKRMNRQVPGQCCCLIYTSGTTGNPKGCMISHDNLIWEAMQVNEMASEERPGLCGPHNRLVSYLPLSHIAGLQMDIMGHLVNECELYFARPDAL